MKKLSMAILMMASANAFAGPDQISSGKYSDPTGEYVPITITNDSSGDGIWADNGKYSMNLKWLDGIGGYLSTEEDGGVPHELCKIYKTSESSISEWCLVDRQNQRWSIGVYYR